MEIICYKASIFDLLTNKVMGCIISISTLSKGDSNEKKERD